MINLFNPGEPRQACTQLRKHVYFTDLCDQQNPLTNTCLERGEYVRVRDPVPAGLQAPVEMLCRAPRLLQVVRNYVVDTDPDPTFKKSGSGSDLIK